MNEGMDGGDSLSASGIRWMNQPTAQRSSPTPGTNQTSVGVQLGTGTITPAMASSSTAPRNTVMAQTTSVPARTSGTPTIRQGRRGSCADRLSALEAYWFKDQPRPTTKVPIPKKKNDALDSCS